MSILHRIPVWLMCWAIAVLAALVIRPPLPVDETRYLAVAWEMWQRGDFIVPYLNGEAYHHKPPLLFWLMNAGWSVFGVNDWWPRMVAPLFALVALWWSARLSFLLWPNDDKAARLTPIILVGAAFWAVFQTLTMFDMMLATCTLAGISGIVRTWRDGGLAGWIITALAIGVGVLAKGPAILLHILPVALSAPWWGPALSGAPDRPLVSTRQWYFRLIVSVVLGVALALLWAIPAGIRGGEEYRNMIFWGQSAGRIVQSFDHARPFYWYLVLIPPLLLPWIIWPRLWRGIKGHVTIADGAVRLLAAWALPALFIFSIISGKQLHYLLPEFAAFALLMAHILSQSADGQGRRFDGAVIAALFAILGLVILLLPHQPDLFREPGWFVHVDTFWGALLLVAAVACWIFAKRDIIKSAAVLALSMSLLVAVVHLSARDVLSFAYDLRPIAQALKAHEDKGVPLANFGTYHGQYQFLGRLEHPMAQLGLEKKTTDAFVAAHPDGIIVAYYHVKHERTFPDDAQPIATYRFRDFDVVFWRAGLLNKYPNLADRF